MSNYIQFTQTTEVESLVKLRNSRNGNPRYRVWFTNGIIGTTPTDAGWVYAIHGGMKTVTIKFHYTHSGRCIIDDMLEGTYINKGENA